MIQPTVNVAELYCAKVVVDLRFVGTNVTLIVYTPILDVNGANVICLLVEYVVINVGAGLIKVLPL